MPTLPLRHLRQHFYITARILILHSPNYARKVATAAAAPDPNRLRLWMMDCTTTYFRKLLSIKRHLFALYTHI